MPADLKLPQLPGLHSNIWPQFGPVVDDEPRSELTTATTDDEGNVFSDVVSEEEEDVWRMPETAVATAKPRFYTWDSFLVDGANAPPNGYISEAGPRVMDAALEEAGDVGTVIRADVFREVGASLREER